ncbi:alpha-L-fucosidase [Verrucomicrobiota bacterium]
MKRLFKGYVFILIAAVILCGCLNAGNSIAASSNDNELMAREDGAGVKDGAQVDDYMQASDEDMQWWKDAKFGVFVHWNQSSLIARSISWSRKAYGPEKYDQLYKKFNPVKFDAREWIRTFKDAGARYFVFVAKHHDGFSMFDSKYTDYDMMATPFARDTCKELADACKAEGVKFQIYYSPVDWSHPDCVNEKNWSPEYEKFFFNQMRELCTNYGKIDGIWWDGGWWAENTPKLYKMMRKLQPHLITNGRIKGANGDYGNRELQLGAFDISRPWEACTVMSGAWSWGGGKKPKSARTCIRTLVNVVGRGGNLLLNTDPMADGAIHPPQKEAFKGIGKWLREYGETIYGTKAGPYKPGPWGACTRKGKNIYLHVLQDWANDAKRILRLPSIDVKVVNCSLLTGGTVGFRKVDGQFEFDLSKSKPDTTDLIIKLETAGSVENLKPVDLVQFATFVQGRLPKVSSNEKSAAYMTSNIFTGKNEGAKIKGFWYPQGGDNDPWVELDLDGKRNIEYITLSQNPRTTDGVKRFELHIHDGNEWRTIHKGKSIGYNFALKCAEGTIASKVKLVLKEVSYGVNLAVFDVKGVASVE